MRNFINRLTAFLKSKDELCGEWITEDGSGFSIMMGAWIAFNPDGTGAYESWSNSGDDTGYHFKGALAWKRITWNQIEITELANPTKETIRYKLQKVNNRIELSNLDDPHAGIEGFWNFAQIMFRKK